MKLACILTVSIIIALFLLSYVLRIFAQTNRWTSDRYMPYYERPDAYRDMAADREPGLSQANRLFLNGLVAYILDRVRQNIPIPASENFIKSLIPFYGEVQGQCTICMGPLGTEEAMVRVPCKHVFHHGCLVQWLKTSGTCPNCRRVFPAIEFVSEPVRSFEEQVDHDEVEGDISWGGASYNNDGDDVSNVSFDS